MGPLQGFNNGTHSLVFASPVFLLCTCPLLSLSSSFLLLLSPLQVTMQLALCGLAEYVFHLSRLDSDVFQIACNNGQLTQTFHVFEINKKGERNLLSFSSTDGSMDHILSYFKIAFQRSLGLNANSLLQYPNLETFPIDFVLAKFARPKVSATL